MTITRCCHIAITAALCIATHLSAQTEWPRVVATPGVSISAESANLSALSFVSVSRNGTIAVGQPQDSRVRFFSPMGADLGSFGRHGAGPGEIGYLSPTISVWSGDSLWVGDNALQRWTLITPSRTLAKTIKPPTYLTFQRSPGVPVRIGGSWLRGVVGGDTLLAVGMRIDDDRKYWGAAVRMRLDGTPLGIVGEALSDGNRSDCTMVGSSRPGLAVAIPYCPISNMVFAPSGDRIVFTSVTLAQQSRGAFTLTVLRSNGDTIRSHEYLVPTDVLDAKEFDAKVSAFPTQVSAGLKGARAPGRYPPASSALMGWDGSVWIGQEGKTDRLWVIIDSAGREAGQFRIPKSVHLWSVGTDKVWGVSEAENGAESVVSYVVAWRH
ncbi:MAG: hypothetical protein ABIS00_14600 [Gemmatimonadales bacterium]